MLFRSKISSHGGSNNHSICKYRNISVTAYSALKNQRKKSDLPAKMRRDCSVFLMRSSRDPMCVTDIGKRQRRLCTEEECRWTVSRKCIQKMIIKPCIRTWYELKDSIPALVLSHAKYLEGSLISTSGGKLHDAMLSVR